MAPSVEVGYSAPSVTLDARGLPILEKTMRLNSMDFEVFNGRFAYDPLASKTGLVYKVDVMSGVRVIKAGAPAGCKHNGYWVVNVHDKQYKVHRIVWMLHKGCDFDSIIDHINGNGLDNRLENLREATFVTNRQNIAVPSNNRSGRVGVSWQEATGRWMSSIMANGKRHFLGYFNSVEEAHAEYTKAKARLHEFQTQDRMMYENAREN